MPYHVTDWDDAYSNFAYIPDAERIVQRMQQAASAFCDAHPSRPLGAGRLFVPDRGPKGLAVFIHGGYWSEPYPDLWSHLAAGPFAHDWAVAMPTYRLAPEATLADMAIEVAQAVSVAASQTNGPIALTGHSAGGQLAARLICGDLLSDDVASRIRACVPISPIADLRPIMRTKMNGLIGLNEQQARQESPIFLTPRKGIAVTCWVGGDERPEFLRQARLLADVWAGLGSATDYVVEPRLNHMTVLDSLTRADSPLTRRLVA
ncbi:alpha/beta hydrolase [Paracoccus sp. 11-3]|uniref:Alpha/beta hydrolase n=1 Tax=Paracoccus amoyensis TaxID=2760093 RepID=A0A926JB67_9RHOB|nr:alpha/beta hydrolase [Paracoccus amoyensis]MBC9246791.1 alpha/beta hydrolase [Paracoccus amoyensis]